MGQKQGKDHSPWTLQNLPTLAWDGLCLGVDWLGLRPKPWASTWTKSQQAEGASGALPSTPLTHICLRFHYYRAVRESMQGLCEVKGSSMGQDL